MQEDLSEEEFLRGYDITKYPRPSLTVDIVTFGVTGEAERNYRQDEKKTLSLLLIKRGGHPCRGKWALPGGFLNMDETLEECAFRELREETDLRPAALMPMGSFSQVDRDPRGRVISSSYISIVDEENVRALAGDDAAEAKWFTIDFSDADKNGWRKLTLRNAEEDITLHADLREERTQFGRSKYELREGGDLAFDHAKIIATAYGIIRKSGNDFETLFDFMPELFTLSGLQKVQETLLGTTVQAANFRRKVMPLVEETDKSTSGAGHRPAKLYRRKKM
ncbi:MAG TPA: NUDIX hydrolase [Treponema sp.]|jgi:ADP-ribose pyrophosphatase YjhB (NUDIX family)|nr:NUDIX hydrolase [Treponema sp.]HBB42431.1 NUDIX hydrolase [Treponema sp.]HCA19520.1 NUDIX hydrolase [Treponema sp.]